MAGGAVCALPAASFSQTAARVWRIGFLTNGTVKSTQGQLDAFVRGMQEQGYAEKRHFVLEARYADGKLERLPALVADLLAQKPDVVFAPSGIAANEVKKSGTRVPIIFAFAPDPVGQGFAKSLSRPGGTMTGLTSTHTELSAKRMELLKELAPAMRRVAVLYFLAPSAAGVAEQLAETKQAARALGLEVVTEESPKVEDFERAFASLRKQRPDALIVIENPMFFTNRVRLTELAAGLKLPAVYNVSEYVQAGGLMSYGASYADLARRAASYAAKILGGREPGELPIERPTRFELVINMNTAKAIGLAIAPSLLLRADATISS
ncbi:MAG TPA: ABC transporter substrate-binding protein [Burkholderiales bacterium]